MPKKTTIRKEKKVMLTDAELIEKYGTDKPEIPFDTMISVMLSKPSPNAPAKVAKRP